MRKKYSYTILVLLCAALLTSLSLSGAGMALSVERAPDRNQQVDFTAYLPIVFNRLPARLPSFGVEPTVLNNTTLLDKAQAINSYWIRYPIISWKDIEPERFDPPTGPVYLWETVDEDGILAANARGMQLIGVIKYTPSWAQLYDGFSCGPIKADSLDEFNEFVFATVQRYSAPPFNIHYWEFGNEPDVDPYEFGWDIYGLWDSGYGCWGDQNDPYYGGRIYGDMLQAAYPAVKSADPQSQVIIGGLLLYCDYTHPPEGQTCLPSKFLIGILKQGGGGYFDYANFHTYPNFHLPSPNYDYDYDDEKWAHRGGMLLGKADFVRRVMAFYSVDKPVMLTEISLVCPTWNAACNNDPIGSGFYEAQADYVVRGYVESWANDIANAIWYSLNDPGWRDAGLLGQNLTPKPAYNAYLFLGQELGQAVFLQQITSYSNVRAYEFKGMQKRIQVLWSEDQSEHIITLPSDVTSILDKYGAAIIIPPEQITTTVKSPIYMELLP